MGAAVEEHSHEVELSFSLLDLFVEQVVVIVVSKYFDQCKPGTMQQIYTMILPAVLPSEVASSTSLVEHLVSFAAKGKRFH